MVNNLLSHVQFEEILRGSICWKSCHYSIPSRDCYLPRSVSSPGIDPVSLPDNCIRRYFRCNSCWVVSSISYTPSMTSVEPQSSSTNSDTSYASATNSRTSNTNCSIYLLLLMLYSLNQMNCKLLDG